MIQNRSTSISPFERLVALQRELDRTLSGAADSPDAGMFSPPMDVIEGENEIQARLDVPGIDPNDIEIRVEDNVLTVSGEKRMETENADTRGYRLVERRYGRFARSFTLPRGVDSARVAATCDHGVLTVHLPKAESSKPRTIKIESGKSAAESSGREIR